jgi:macrodomain Ter protein organizer (MatP/YcbG family)
VKYRALQNQRTRWLNQLAMKRVHRRCDLTRFIPESNEITSSWQTPSKDSEKSGIAIVFR